MSLVKNQFRRICVDHVPLQPYLSQPQSIYNHYDHPMKAHALPNSVLS